MEIISVGVLDLGVTVLDLRVYWTWECTGLGSCTHVSTNVKSVKITLYMANRTDHRFPVVVKKVNWGYIHRVI